ncbi:MAG TPA: amidohydrolase family protein [Chthoniobacteraceae bacterium]|jgi:predicted TIM-barrel fold metal-dependent hydrolase|nr:amidohydrolase family protein [Chthoniobacteraceae bacterium]
MPLTRRHFLLTSTCALAGHAFGETPAEPIIDIHQHTGYHARTNEDLLLHQRTMGVTQTILLPAGTPMMTPSTHQGKSNGLAAKAMGNDSVRAFAAEHPGEFLFGANEVTDAEHARAEIEAGLKLGAKVIGEQKFGIQCDSAESQVLYGLAQEYNVPVLLHFQHLMYNLGYERFYTMLEKFPKVNFVGHAQTVWGNIDKNNTDQAQLYPKGPVTPGGLTDVMLTKYPNFYADMSAGSGLNALTRDEEHTRAFLERHQEKLLFGSDCADAEGQGEKCTGAMIIAAIRKLAPSKAVERKLLYENAKRLFRLG